MAKKPAPLTSDLLVKKGDAAPSSIAPETGSESPIDAQEPAATAAVAPGPAANETEGRPSIPEPDYVIAPEDDEGEDRFQSRRLLAGVLAIVALATAGALGYSLFQNTETGEVPNVAPLATAEPEAAPAQAEAPSVAPLLQPSGPPSDGSPTPPGAPALRPSDTGPVVDTPVEVVTPAVRAPEAEDAAPAADVTITESPRTPATITPPPNSVPAPVERPVPAELNAAAPAETAPALAQPGQYVIQLLSVRSEDGARNAWNRLQNTHTALLGDEVLNLETANLGERGTYYRVRFGAFDAKADAIAVCSALKEQGQDCLVKRISN